jgi:hypothetical protein
MNSIIRRLSSRSIGAQKNGVQRVRERLPQRLRQALAAGARSWLRRSGSLSRFSHAPGHLHGLWREERKAGLSVGQHQIHVAVCHADWRVVSCHDDHRCGAADASRLAHRQGARQALHARAARACRAASTAPNAAAIRSTSSSKSRSVDFFVFFICFLQKLAACVTTCGIIGADARPN